MVEGEEVPLLTVVAGFRGNGDSCEVALLSSNGKEEEEEQKNEEDATTQTRR